MDYFLKDKNAIVCGSTAGIGKAAAIELAKHGTKVTLIARNQTKLEKMVKMVNEINKKDNDYVCVDFNFPKQLKTKITTYKEKNQNPIHVLVNNTGGPPAGPVLKADIQEFQKAFSSHLICNQILAQAFVPGMKEENYGRIINIISTSVKQPIRGLGVSNTIRGAVASWAKTLAGELAEYGITVNNVLPGATKTDRLYSIFESRAEKSGKTAEEEARLYMSEIPAKRFAEPEEIAYAIAFLASPLASYITGHSLPVDGGRIQGL
jgi:3-oxoacyl-[acyl-carrier protein] reductase